VPAEAVVVHPDPGEAEAEGAGGHDGGKGAAAHGLARGIVVGEGAERDAGVAHAGGGVGEGEEEHLEDDGEEKQRGGSGAGERGQVELQQARAGDVADGRGEAEERGADADSVDGSGHDAAMGGGGLRLEGEVGVGVAVPLRARGDGCVELQALPFGGGGGFESALRRVGNLLGLDLEDAQLGPGRRFFAQRTLGDARPGFARGDELAGELDDVGGNGERFQGELGELRGAAKLDFLFQLGQLGLGWLALPRRLCLERGRGGDVFVEADGDAAGGEPRLGHQFLRAQDDVGEFAANLGLGCGAGSCGKAEGCGLLPAGELGQQILLHLGDGRGVALGDFGFSVGLLQGALGFGGKKLAVALGLLVAGGDGFADHAGTAAALIAGSLGTGTLAGFRFDGASLLGGAALAVRGEPLRRDGLEGVGAVGRGTVRDGEEGGFRRLYSLCCRPDAHCLFSPEARGLKAVLKPVLKRCVERVPRRATNSLPLWSKLNSVAGIPPACDSPVKTRRRCLCWLPLTLLFISTIGLPGIDQHLAAQEVINQAPPAATAQPADLPDLATIPRAAPMAPHPAAEDRAVLESDTQSRHGDLYLLAGNVVITYRDHILTADTVTYNAATGEAEADGHMRLRGGENGELIEASHGTYNLRSSTGRFFEVHGSVGLEQAATVTGPQTNPFLFAGRLVVKTGPTNYDVYDGWVTSCEMPNPDWLLTSKHLGLNDKKAFASNSTFRLLRVPVLFLPYVTHPVDASARQSGFLIPVISESSTKGFVFGEQVYLTLGRSADLTSGFEYYSLRGFSEMSTFRYRGSGQDFFNMHFSALQDRGYDATAGLASSYINQGGEDVTAAFRRDFSDRVRAVGDAEYLSSYVYREAFNDNYDQAVSSDITSIVYLTRESNGFALDGRFDRYQGLKRVPYTNPKGITVAGEEVHLFHAPQIDADLMDRHVGSSPVLFNLTGSVGGLKRVQPNPFDSGVVYRQDIRPEVALPLAGGGWSTLTSVAVRDTFYGKSREAPYGPSAVPIELNASVNRASVEIQSDIRPPAIERTFEVPQRWQKFLGAEVRHTVEPELTYRYTGGINNFLSVLRFDDVDLDSDTNELQYGVTQHLFFKPVAHKPKARPGCSAATGAAAAASAATVAGPETEEDEETTADEREEERSSILPTSASATDANGIPSIAATAPDRPTRAHHKQDPCAEPAKESRQQEWFSWRLAQTHYFDQTFGGAVIAGRRNVFTSTINFSGIAFLTEPRSISPLISRMRFRTSSHTDVEWDFDLDTGAKKFTSSNVFLDVHEGQWFGGFSYAGLSAPGRFYTEQINTVNNTSILLPSPTSNFSQMRVLLGYGTPTKPGLSVAGNAGLDIYNSSLQYASVQASYNWNCCGLSVEYRKYELGSVRNESVERFSFTLINIGTAGNLRRTERLF
jgi:LPS-assembly protein